MKLEKIYQCTERQRYRKGKQVKEIKARYRESDMRLVRIIEGENKANRREQIR